MDELDSQDWDEEEEALIVTDIQPLSGFLEGSTYNVADDGTNFLEERQELTSPVITEKEPLPISPQRMDATQFSPVDSSHAIIEDKIPNEIPSAKLNYSQIQTTITICPDCGMKFKDRGTRGTHICVNTLKETYTPHELKHRQIVKLNGMVFKSENKQHAQVLKHIEKKFPCPECNDKFVTHSELRRHLCKSVCNPAMEPYFKCKCEKIFETERQLQSHQIRRECIEEAKFPCPECNNNFVTQNQLKHHQCKSMCNPAIELFFKCKCEEIFVTKRQLKSHQRLSGECIEEATSFHCKCGTQFKEKRYLRQHLRRHNDPSAFFCQHCKIQFSSSKKFKEHNMFHGLARKYPIFNCPMGIKVYEVRCFKNSKVKNGKVITYNCCVCNDVLHTKHGIQLHIYNHLSHTSHKCPFCFRFFFNYMSLDYHIFTGKWLEQVCEFCRIVYPNGQGLKEHMLKHPQCSYCRLVFKDDNDLHNHWPCKRKDLSQSFNIDDSWSPNSFGISGLHLSHSLLGRDSYLAKCPTKNVSSSVKAPKTDKPYFLKSQGINQFYLGKSSKSDLSYLADSQQRAAFCLANSQKGKSLSVEDSEHENQRVPVKYKEISMPLGGNEIQVVRVPVVSEETETIGNMPVLSGDGNTILKTVQENYGMSSYSDEEDSVKLPIQKVTSSGDTSFRCSMCGKIFPIQKSLKDETAIGNEENVPKEEFVYITRFGSYTPLADTIEDSCICSYVSTAILKSSNVSQPEPPVAVFQVKLDREESEGGKIIKSVFVRHLGCNKHQDHEYSKSPFENEFQETADDKYDYEKQKSFDGSDSEYASLEEDEEKNKEIEGRSKTNDIPVHLEKLQYDKYENEKDTEEMKKVDDQGHHVEVKSYDLFKKEEFDGRKEHNNIFLNAECNKDYDEEERPERRKVDMVAMYFGKEKCIEYPENEKKEHEQKSINIQVHPDEVEHNEYPHQMVMKKQKVGDKVSVHLEDKKLIEHSVKKDNEGKENANEDFEHVDENPNEKENESRTIAIKFSDCQEFDKPPKTSSRLCHFSDVVKNFVSDEGQGADACKSLKKIKEGNEECGISTYDKDSKIPKTHNRIEYQEPDKPSKSNSGLKSFPEIPAISYEEQIADGGRIIKENKECGASASDTGKRTTKKSKNVGRKRKRTWRAHTRLSHANAWLKRLRKNPLRETI